LNSKTFAIKPSLEGYRKALCVDHVLSSDRPSVCNLVSAVKSSLGFSWLLWNFVQDFFTKYCGSNVRFMKINQL